MRLPTSSRRWRPAATWLSVVTSLLPLTAPLHPLAPAGAAVLAPTTCPAAAVTLLDGLYRWHLAHQDDRGPLVLASQRARFAPALYSQLVRAAALTPADGGFLDFDVFSGTQVNTFAARVQGCRSRGGRLEAVVAVEAGLRRRSDLTPQLLRYTLEPNGPGRWRILDITYPTEPSFSLAKHLEGLLKPGR